MINIYESIKALEIKTVIVFYLILGNLFCFPFFSFFFMIELYFLIPAVKPQIFNPTAELIVTAGRRTN